MSLEVGGKGDNDMQSAHLHCAMYSNLYWYVLNVSVHLCILAGYSLIMSSILWRGMWSVVYHQGKLPAI